MAAYRFSCTIDDVHRLELPSEIPSGPAEVVVFTKAGGTKPFASMVRNLLSHPAENLTSQEIADYLRRERDTWE